MKKLINLNGVKKLNRMQQKAIQGGEEPGDRCDGDNGPCSVGEICCGGPGAAQYCQTCPCQYHNC